MTAYLTWCDHPSRVLVRGLSSKEKGIKDGLLNKPGPASLRPGKQLEHSPAPSLWQRTSQICTIIIGTSSLNPMSQHSSYHPTFIMPSSPWHVNSTHQEQPARSSLLGSLRRLSRKGSSASQRSDHSANSELQTPATPTFRGPADLSPFSPNGTPSPLANPSPATR